ncbi:DNA excision repair protein ERCC-8 [Chamberlinius hualienensis]
MIRNLENLRLGMLSPTQFGFVEKTKRSQSLELSKFREVEKVFRGGVNTLDIEDVEGRYLLSGTSNGWLYIHDLDNLSGKPNYTCKAISDVPSTLRYTHKRSIETVQWYPHDTGLFLSSGMDHKLIAWDTNVLKPADTYTMDGRIYQHHMSSIATKHCLIAVGSSSSHVSLIDLKTGSSTQELRGHRNGIVSVKWSSRNEYLLASGGFDNRILLWDVRAARGYLRTLDQHGGSADANTEQMATAHNGVVNGLCFTEDGLFLISYGTDKYLRLWDTFTGNLSIVNYGKILNESKKAMRFDVSKSSSQDFIYVPSSDGKIIMFDLHTGIKIGTLIGHFNAANCCVFHPFYQELYSGANDKDVLVWTADIEQTRAVDEEKRKSDGDQQDRFTFLMRKNVDVTADAWSSDEGG